MIRDHTIRASRPYDVQYRGDFGPWIDWLVETTDRSARFTGKRGHLYFFRCRARDKAGNLEAWAQEAGHFHLYFAPMGEVMAMRGRVLAWLGRECWEWYWMSYHLPEVGLLPRSSVISASTFPGGLLLPR